MDGLEKFFTVFHIVAGQFLMSFAMAAFARHLIASKDVWYVCHLGLHFAIFQFIIV